MPRRCIATGGGDGMTRDELDRIDRLIAGKPELPPERIYHWLHSQMSIARYYGGLRYKEHQYFISKDEEGQPLVRGDVLAKERKAAAQAAKDKRKADKQQAAAMQGGLI